MIAIADTGFILALVNKRDINHARAVEAASKASSDSLILPVSVLTEVCYLIASRLGHTAMRRFIQEVADGGINLETVTLHDLHRSVEILSQYADSRLDFVDATIVAIAERKGVSQVITYRRDFSIIRPRHCAYFNLLPLKMVYEVGSLSSPADREPLRLLRIQHCAQLSQLLPATRGGRI